MKAFNFQFSIFNFQLIFLLTAGIFSSCSDFDDNYSTNRAHKLSFSTDTIAFDMVFTTISSSTKQLVVYNKNKEPLNIESIRLASNFASGFRINVDGRSGESFNNIPILGKDSMYVFVETTIDPTGHNGLLLIEDKLEFVVNGGVQAVLLSAEAQDVNLIKGGLFITKDTTLKADRPYLVYDSIVVDKGVKLRLERGAQFYMYNKAKLIIDGTLIAPGSLGMPILFRGHRLDGFSENIPYDRLPGQWNGIWFGSESFDNVMEHVIIRNGSRGLTFAASTPDRSKLKISNSQITNMDTRLLHAVNCNIEAVNSEFSNAQDSTVVLEGGEYKFIHCTLTNYFRFTPGRSGESLLTLRNYTSDSAEEDAKKTFYPVKNAVFENCLIDGSYSEELTIEADESVELNYSFNHCLIKTKEKEGLDFASVTFISNESSSLQKPSYKSIGNGENFYVYDFRLNITKDKDGKPATDQVAIGKADPFVAEKYPLDRFGISRVMSEDGPDIGAYEYVPDPEE